MALEANLILNNRYQIIKPLGEGGFGEVYQAWDLRLEGYCAVKRNLQPSIEARRQFEQEAKMLFKLIHQNLPRVHDYFKINEDEQYLVMDFVEGENLREYLNRAGPPAVEQALIWIDQVCDALNYLHTRQPPVVHRDIKPANIIITPDKRAMLVDFGIAKADPQMRTLSGARAWTPGYAPPEQYGQGRTDARSDVYSLAATAYALLTGESPPDAMDVAAGTMKPARPVQEINPAAPAHVGRAIAKAMTFNREQRTPSAEEFRQALRKRTKPAVEKATVFDAQKTILEPRPVIPPAPDLKTPAPREETPPPREETPPPREETPPPREETPPPVIADLVEEQVSEEPKDAAAPVEEPAKKEQYLAAAGILSLEKLVNEEQQPVPEESLQIAQPQDEVGPPAVELPAPVEKPVEEERQEFAVGILPGGKPEEQEPAPVPEASLPVEKTVGETEAQVFPVGMQTVIPIMEKQAPLPEAPTPPARKSILQQLGWKGIAAILGVLVIVIIAIIILGKPTEPDAAQKTADSAGLVEESTQDGSLSRLATQTPIPLGESRPDERATETTAVEAGGQGVGTDATATLSTLSRFKDARTATALAGITATDSAAARETLATPTATATLQPVYKTATPTPGKKPKKRDDSQITLQPGITLEP